VLIGCRKICHVKGRLYKNYTLKGIYTKETRTPYDLCKRPNIEFTGVVRISPRSLSSIPGSPRRLCSGRSSRGTGLCSSIMVLYCQL